MVTRGSRSVHATAICASDCPRPAGDGRQPADAIEVLIGQHAREERLVLGGTRPGGDAVQVPVGQQSLRERAEGDGARACLLQGIEQAVLDPAVEHRVRRLVDEQRHAHLAEDARGLQRAPGRVGRDARVQRLALLDCGRQRAHGLLQRSLRVRPMVVVDVDVVEAEAIEALVEARQQVLARAQVAVRSGPHVPAGLGRDHQLVAEAGEVLLEDPTGVDLRGAEGRTVVVGEVEVRDAQVEGRAHDGALRLQRLVVAEVVPEAEGHRRQEQPAATAAAVGHAPVVASGIGHVLIDHGHGPILSPTDGHRRQEASTRWYCARS